MSTKNTAKPPSSRESRKGKPTSGKETASSKERNQKELEDQQQKPDIENAEQKIQHLETEGFGRFEFIDGTIYEGQWKLVNGIKMRHGEGVLKHGGNIDIQRIKD